jgi:hypothetical protein
MDRQVGVRCRCGAVRGIVTGASPQSVNRVVCYCDDCQAYAHQLGRADLLNAKGGSDIVQLAPAALTFTEGQDRIAGLRLTPKGLHRWYASCCNTPVGNPVQSFDAPRVDDVFGAPVGEIFGKCAVGEPPPGSTRFSPTLFLRAIGKVIGWRLRGKTWPHPFFAHDTRAPIYPVAVISRDRREALRACCGPHPTAQAVP